MITFDTHPLCFRTHSTMEASLDSYCFVAYDRVHVAQATTILISFTAAQRQKSYHMSEQAAHVYR